MSGFAAKHATKGGIWIVWEVTITPKAKLVTLERLKHSAEWFCQAGTEALVIHISPGAIS